MVKPDSWIDVASWIKYYGAHLLNHYDKNEALIMVCFFIVIVFFLKNLFRYLAAYFIIPLRNGVVKDLRSNIYQRYLQLPEKFYDQQSKGDLMSRIIADSIEVEWSILSFLEVLFKSPLIIIGSLAFMLYISPQLSVFVFVLLLFTILIIGFISRSLKQDSGEVQSRLGTLSSIVEQSLSGMGILKAYQAESYMTRKFERENHYIFAAINRLLRRRDLSSPLSEFMGVTIVAVLLAYGSKLVFDDVLSAETFFAFIFAFYQVIEPAKSFSTAYYNFKKGLAAVERIEEVTHLDMSESTVDRIQNFPGNWKTWKFNNLTFKYEKALNPTLQNLNVELSKGDKLAIVGSSGSGKSTLLKLIQQQYIDYKGDMTFDDLPLKDISLPEIRSNIAIVSQQAILFSDSILQNILLGRTRNEEKLQSVLEICLLHPLVERLENGLEHQVGDSGNLLSGGECQRITIARALYGNPDVILFDEATSALDAQSELMVTKAIGRAIQNRTAIIVAHRLSTIKLANKVLVLEDGRVDQFGDIVDLSKQKGNFKSYLEAYGIL